MSTIKVTFISVGSGDSILIEHISKDGSREFGLIDCNDSKFFKSTHIYLRRYFDVIKVSQQNGYNKLKFIMLSHFHADHASGLIDLMWAYEPEKLFYSSKSDLSRHAPIKEFIKNDVLRTTALDDSSSPIQFGEASMRVIWPLRESRTKKQENNNSLVVVLTHKNNSFLFSGDAEKTVWNHKKMKERISGLKNLRVFKVPHHGAKNGTLHDTANTLWIDHVPEGIYAPMSSHNRPYKHPNEKVVSTLKKKKAIIHNTQITLEQNIEFTSDGDQMTVKYYR